MGSISDQLHSILFLEDRFNLLSTLSQQFFQYGEEHSKEVLKFLKIVIKTKKNPPTVKLQALRVIEALMASNNHFIIDFCGKKFFNRFKIFAEFRKECKDSRRGTNLFGAEARFQQIASEEFLVLLLQCVEKWAVLHPVDSKGKATYYAKLYNYLLSKGVSFPKQKTTQEEEELKKSLARIRKNVKAMLEFIAENKSVEKIKRIGMTLKNSNQMIENQIVKYMDMEDHDLIKDLNLTLDLLNDGKSAFKAWKERTSRVSILDNPQFTLPPSCLFLGDISPKLLPVPDELSDSIQDINLDEPSPGPLLTDRENETDKEFTLSHEWTGLGADYCRLKDKLDLSEQNALSYQLELEKYSNMYIEESQQRESLEAQVEALNAVIMKISQEHSDKMALLADENQELKDIIKNLNERVQLLQVKIEKSHQEIGKFTDLTENLEAANMSLVSNCKSLENEVEKYVENEKLLKKQIKELFKKINKKKLDKDSSPRSDIIVQIEDSPTKNLRFSLISKSEEELLVGGPLSCEDAQGDVTQDENTLEALASDGFIVAHEPTNKLTHIDNFDNFKDSIRKKHGVIYDSPFLKISCVIHIDGFQGKAKIRIENKTGEHLTDLKTKLYSDSADGIFLAIDSEKVEVLEKEGVVNKIIVFECRAIFQVFPLMKITYKSVDEKMTFVLLLPIAYTLFCEKEEIDLIKEWDAIDEYIETIVKTDIDSVRKVAKSILFSKNFQHSYVEGNGVIIASKSPVGVVLAVVTLKDSQASIQVKCKNLKIRDLISSMIVTQVLPQLS